MLRCSIGNRTTVGQYGGNLARIDADAPSFCAVPVSGRQMGAPNSAVKPRRDPGAGFATPCHPYAALPLMQIKAAHGDVQAKRLGGQTRTG